MNEVVVLNGSELGNGGFTPQMPGFLTNESTPFPSSWIESGKIPDQVWDDVPLRVLNKLTSYENFWARFHASDIPDKISTNAYNIDLTALSGYCSIPIIPGATQQMTADNTDSDVARYCMSETIKILQHFTTGNQSESIFPMADWLPIGKTREEYQFWLDDKLPFKPKPLGEGGFTGTISQPMPYTFVNRIRAMITDQTIHWIEDIVNENVMIDNWAYGRPKLYFTQNDLLRIFTWYGNTYNLLSKAYGTAQNRWLIPVRLGRVRPTLWQRIWSGIKKAFPVFIIMRGAFIILVEANLFGMATRMSQQIESQGNSKLKTMWRGYGGNWGNLQGAINNAKNRAALLNGSDDYANLGAGIDWAALATALPIVLDCLKLIRSFFPAQQGNDFDNFLAGFSSAAALANSPHCAQYTAMFVGYMQAVLIDGSEQDYDEVMAGLTGMGMPADCAEIFYNAREDIINPLTGIFGGGNRGGTDIPGTPGGEGTPGNGNAPGNSSGGSSMLLPALVVGGALMMSNRRK